MQLDLSLCSSQCNPFQDKLWKICRDNQILKENKLLLREDLTHADKMQRNKLWPPVEAGTDAYIEEKRVSS